MVIKIHFPSLPQGRTLDIVKAELGDVLADDGWLLGSAEKGGSGYIELELEDEKMNPKYGILAVKNYLQKAGFDPYTTIDLQGTKSRIFD